MENKDITDESAIKENIDNETIVKSRYRKKEEYKEKKCEIIRYNKNTKTLDIKFKKYGIRIKNVDDIQGTTTVTIKYKGEIGKPNFEYKL